MMEISIGPSEQRVDGEASQQERVHPTRIHSGVDELSTAHVSVSGHTAQGPRAARGSKELFEAFHPLSKVNFYALQYTLMN
jgi:hypothetical protein